VCRAGLITLPGSSQTRMGSLTAAVRNTTSSRGLSIGSLSAGSRNPFQSWTPALCLLMPRSTIPGHAPVVGGLSPSGHGWSRQHVGASVIAGWQAGSSPAGVLSGFRPVIPTLLIELRETGQGTCALCRTRYVDSMLHVFISYTDVKPYFYALFSYPTRCKRGRGRHTQRFHIIHTPSGPREV